MKLGLFLFFSLLGFNSLGADPSTGEILSPAKLLAMMFAGIGIFLVGVKYIGSHLDKMSSGTFKNMVAKISNNPASSFIAGNTLGFFTQSAKASSFILAGFVQADIINVKRALPIVYWCNAGASIIVLASALPIKMLVMYLLGVTALGITFHWPKKLFHAYGALFGIGMIMYGLFLLKSGAAGFIDYPWLPSLLEKISGIFILSFLLGAALTIIAQSDMAVAMIIIAMASSGLFEFEESSMIIYGTQAGAAALTFMFSFNFKGRARQVVMAQVFFKSIITAIFLIFFVLEVWLGIPLINSFVSTLNIEIGIKVAMLTLLVSYLGAAIVVVFNNSILMIVKKLYKPSQSEVLSETKFLGSMISDNSETGLLLVEQEQFEILQRLPKYFDYVRNNIDVVSKNSSNVNPDAYHEAFLQISKEISEVLSKISGKGLGEVESELLIRTMKSHEQLINIESIVYKIASKMQDKKASRKALILGQKVLDSMDFMILTQIEALRNKDNSELMLLKNLTSDRGEMMDSVRKKYMKSEKDLTESDRNFVLDITILFENGVATLHRSVDLLI